MWRWRLTKIKRNGLSAPSRTSSLGSSSPWWTLGPTSLRPGHTFGGEMWPGGAWHCSLSACLALFVVWPLQVCAQTRASISQFLAKFSVHTTSHFRETMGIRKSLTFFVDLKVGDRIICNFWGVKPRLEDFLEFLAPSSVSSTYLRNPHMTRISIPSHPEPEKQKRIRTLQFMGSEWNL